MKIDDQPPSKPYTHKKLPKGKAIMFPTHDPALAIPHKRLLSAAGAH